MLSFLASLLAAICVGVLKAYVQRADLSRGAQLELLAQIQAVGNDAARRAYEWQIRASGAPDGGAGLRVQPGAPAITADRIPGNGPPADGGPGGA